VDGKIKIKYVPGQNKGDLIQIFPIRYEEAIFDNWFIQFGQFLGSL